MRDFHAGFMAISLHWCWGANTVDELMSGATRYRAHQALDWLANLPLPADATIEVVSASCLPFSAKAVAAMGWPEFLAESRRVVDDACARLAKRWTAVTGRVLDGDAREAIVEAAIQGKADLIVVGARGLGAAASFLLGSSR